MGCNCAKSVHNVNGDVPKGTDGGGVPSGKAQKAEDLREVYKLGKLLGTGAFGQVRECTHRQSSEVFAVKIMEKHSSEKGHWSNENMFRREVQLLGMIQHPNIIKYMDFYEDRYFLYAVMEKCEGGELFEAILRVKTFGERMAAVLCYQMLKALEYLHNLGVVHRDVKAENFLFKFQSLESPVKLIDFGMSAKISKDQQLADVCGSPHYLSPELIRRKYDTKADIWALGVLIYLMLFGRYPFDGASTNAIVKEILTRRVDWSANGVWPSDKAIHFLRSLLQRDVSKRPTAAEASMHPWLAAARAKVEGTPGRPLTTDAAPAPLPAGPAASPQALVPAEPLKNSIVVEEVSEGRPDALTSTQTTTTTTVEEDAAEKVLADLVLRSGIADALPVPEGTDVLPAVRAAYERTHEVRRNSLVLVADRRAVFERKLAEMEGMWRGGNSHCVRLTAGDLSREGPEDRMMRLRRHATTAAPELDDGAPDDVSNSAASPRTCKTEAAVEADAATTRLTEQRKRRLRQPLRHLMTVEVLMPSAKGTATLLDVGEDIDRLADSVSKRLDQLRASSPGPAPQPAAEQKTVPPAGDHEPAGATSATVPPTGDHEPAGATSATVPPAGDHEPAGATSANNNLSTEAPQASQPSHPSQPPASQVSQASQTPQTPHASQALQAPKVIVVPPPNGAN